MISARISNLSKAPAPSCHRALPVLRAVPAVHQEEPSCSYCQPSDVLTRRTLIATGLTTLALVPALPSSANVGFKKDLKKKRLSEDDYVQSDAVGLKISELEPGSGSEIALGDRVVVHYDCIYRGIDVVSSRAARLLGGNRTISEPYEYVVGEVVLGQALKKISEGAGGLFAGISGPKPPQALSKAVVGMRKGGKRSILVDVPELGYPKGVQEIPAGATFELKVEVLDVIKRAA